MVVDKGRWGHDLLLVDVDGFPAIPELVHDPDDAVDAGNSHHHDPDELPGLVRLVPVEHRVDVHLSVGVHAAASPVAKAEDHVVEHEQRRLVQVEDVARPARHQQIRHRRHAVHPVHHEIHYMKRTFFVENRPVNDGDDQRRYIGGVVQEPRSFCQLAHLVAFNSLTQSPETLSGDGGTEDEVERLQQKSLMSQIDEPVVGICIGRSIGNQQAQEEGRADESKN